MNISVVDILPAVKILGRGNGNGQDAHSTRLLTIDIGKISGTGKMLIPLDYRIAV
ncbi:MAG: hypothetical protein F6K39_14115 [Okeania sp. SIO3B3]|nr:hypothetical protein [Okeania sp. SIO3B3]